MRGKAAEYHPTKPAEKPTSETVEHHGAEKAGGDATEGMTENPAALAPTEVNGEAAQAAAEAAPAAEAAAPVPPLPPLELGRRTMRGDVRDAIVSLVKTSAKAWWDKLPEYEQRQFLRAADTLGDDIVNSAVELVASRGFKHLEITIGKFTVDAEKGILASFTMPHNKDNLLAMGSVLGTEVCMVPMKASDFLSERSVAKPDNIGSLAMPRNGAGDKKNGVDAPTSSTPTSGPGAPSDAAAMAALGRGPVDAEGKPIVADADGVVADPPVAAQPERTDAQAATA